MGSDGYMLTNTTTPDGYKGQCKWCVGEIVLHYKDSGKVMAGKSLVFRYSTDLKCEISVKCRHSVCVKNCMS